MTTTRSTRTVHVDRIGAPISVIGTLALVASACGSATVTTATTTLAPTVTTAATAAATAAGSTAAAAPGRPTGDLDVHVPVAGTDIHVRCHGTGPSTVVLIAGFGDGSEVWSAVEPALADAARVCAYDRPGTGLSGPAVDIQTFATQADQLDLALAAAGEPGPYVLVGHSFGGGAAVRFATDHRAAVAGLVLIDASPIGWPTSLCAIDDDGTGAATFIRSMCDGWSDPAGNPEHLDVFAAFAELDTLGGPDGVAALGDVPVTVITAEHRELPADTSAAERTRLDGAWATGQRRWAAISTSSQVVPVSGTGHYVQLEEPAVVVDAIARLLP